MRNKKIIYGFLFALVVLFLILGVVIHLSKTQNLKVVFFDVGQGDAILISQGNNQILIDSGKSGQIILEKLGRYVPFWDRKIEALIMTHPDQDHIGGFADIFESYEVATVIKTNAKSDSQTFGALEESIIRENPEVVEAKSGVKIVFPNQQEMEIVYPFDSVIENAKDANGFSIVSLLKVGESKFLFTGDLTSEKEDEILQKRIDISADFLKVGHHGSKYSTGEEFLQKVFPREAVISVGKNSYGHPAPEVLGKIKNIGAKILRTDEAGDIVYECKSSIDGCQRIAN